MNAPRRIAGVIWYRMEEYDACRALMADGHNLPTTYAQWRMGAEQGEKKFRREGWETTRAYIDPAKFPAWCASMGLNIDAQARNLFANVIAKEAADHLE